MDFIWVVRRRDLFPTHAPHGYLPLPEDELEEHYLRPARERGFFVERREAERCPAWKQPIPYCIVEHEGELLVLERLAAQSESRLHGLLSIGIGGHVDPPDAAGTDEIFRAACLRELHEELELDGEFALETLGLLNDDSTEVGAVHVGLVHRVRCVQRPRVRESDKMRGRWVPLAESQELCKTPALLESWSRMLLDHAHRVASATGARFSSF